MRWAGNVADIGEMKNAKTVLTGKTEGKGPSGRDRRKILK
jgi:hypothetical protein